MWIDGFYIDFFMIQYYSVLALSIISVLPLIFKQGRQSMKNTPIWVLPLMYLSYFVGIIINWNFLISVLFVACIIQAIAIYRGCFIIDIDIKWRPYIKEKKEDDI